MHPIQTGADALWKTRFRAPSIYRGYRWRLVGTFAFFDSARETYAVLISGHAGTMQSRVRSVRSKGTVILQTGLLHFHAHTVLRSVSS